MIVKDVANRVKHIKSCPVLAFTARAYEEKANGKDVIILSLGESDFDTPSYIKEAAIKAIQDGFIKNTATDGIIELKKEIIKKFEKDNSLQYDLSQVIVSCGGKHSLYNLFAAILDEGDEVIIPAPYWISYPDMVKLVGGVPIIIEADIEQNFKITATQLEQAITDLTRLIILNTPSNPTGAVYTQNELKVLGEILLSYPHILIVSDDLYENNIWGNEPFTNILMCCPKLYDRCVIINGVSKAYAMTGWRIGYAVGPFNIIDAMKKIQSQTTSHPASISQIAAQAAISGDQSYARMMTEAYKERHDYLMSELKKIRGMQVIPSAGTFYSFVCIKEFLKESKVFNDDIEFTEFLLDKAGVAILPGSMFGMQGYIRLSYAANMRTLQEAIKRIRDAISNLKS